MPTRVLAVASSSCLPLFFYVVALEHATVLPSRTAVLVYFELRGLASELATEAAAHSTQSTEDMLAHVGRHQQHDAAQRLRELDEALGLGGTLRAELVAVHREAVSQ